MPVNPTYPGVYVGEVSSGLRTITGTGTSDTAFVDFFRRGPRNTAIRVTSFGEFERVFGGLDTRSEASYAIHQFFLNGGSVAWVVRVAARRTAIDSSEPGTPGWTANGPAALMGSEERKTGMFALDRIDPSAFNILCIPATANLDHIGMNAVISKAEQYCLAKRAFLIIDIPASVDTSAKMVAWMEANESLRHANAAVYFPRLVVPDPHNAHGPRNVGPSGTLAGVYARTDASRGVWKAPAGAEADLRGADLAMTMTDLENATLNPLGINALRHFATGNVSWGARTLVGSDQQAGEWKYIPVRRTALYIERSLSAGSQWVVFEPNDEPLWAAIRLSVDTFMHDLFRQGALQGATPSQAYFVTCGAETTSEDDVARGVVNILVGFAPLKPAEFVLIRIQQRAGQVAP